MQTDAYSGHADQTELLDWLGKFKSFQIKKIFITHGDDDARDELAKLINQKYQIKPVIPKFNESFEI